MLRFYALLLAGSARPGLLQRDAFRAGFFCATDVRSSRFVRPRCIRGSTSLNRVLRREFRKAPNRRAFERRADLSVAWFNTSPRLV